MGKEPITQVDAVLARINAGAASADEKLLRDEIERLRAVENTARVEWRSRHRQRLESIEQLASGVAIEMNTPIQSIMAYAQRVIRGADPAAIKHYAEETLHESQRLVSIVKSLLAFARREGEPHTDAMVQVIVHDLLALMSAALRNDAIRVEVDMAQGLPPVRCHPQQLQQVLINLINNARDALNARDSDHRGDKRIVIIRGRLWRRESESFVRLTVEDFGVGMAPEIFDRVFEPFWTCKAPNAPGLGLAESREIVVEHGGAISVESELGWGSRFHVDLPCRENAHREPV